MTLLVHAVSSFTMLGLIWTVQLVHYPLFASVGRAEWTDYHARHVRSIGYFVAPLMVAELLTGVLLAAHGSGWVVWMNLALIGVAWASTAFLQMPLHRKLAQRHDPDLVRRLVGTNWIRTIAWTLHGALVVMLLSPA